MSRFLVGGPWFRNVIDVRTMGTVVALAYDPPPSFECIGIRGMDALLDLARTLLMAQALASSCEWLISLDNDIELSDRTRALLWSKVAAIRAHGPDVALVACPAPLRRGVATNVIPRDGESLDGHPSVARIGMGCVAFSLGWYRRNWPTQEPYFQSRVTGTREGWLIEGEDYRHCDRVRELGGQVWAAWGAPALHHRRGDD